MIISWSNREPPPSVNSRAGLPNLPSGVLDRHGAKMLNPAGAVRLAGQTLLGSTAYRTSVLLIPDDLLRGPGNIAEINAVLGDIGLAIIVPSNEAPRPYLPRPIRLRPVGDEPVLVDAWPALQTLRAAARRGILNVPVDRISLDHLVTASSASGAGSLEGVPGMGNGTAAEPVNAAMNSDYLLRPVAVPMRLPARRTGTELNGNRRAVVAVLDTGIAENEHLGVTDLRSGDRSKWSIGDFVMTSDSAQKAVYEAERDMRAQDFESEVGVIVDARDAPNTAEPLVGALNKQFGHSTFIEGIIRQIAPDSQVLAVRVLYGDGIGYQSSLLAALGALVNRVERAQRSQEYAHEMVDIVSLSLGYCEETAQPERKPTSAAHNGQPVDLTPALTKVINELRDLGVIVVAAAGNFASDRPFVPAALSVQKRDKEPTPRPVQVISVGALNINGSKAIFANDNASVTCWATGAGIVSTFPQRINASRTPSVQVPWINGKGLPQFRESSDGDDYFSGYASWTGSSFAAPYVAGRIAALLQDRDLTEIDRVEARRRGAEVVADLRAARQRVVAR